MFKLAEKPALGTQMAIKKEDAHFVHPIIEYKFESRLFF